ncbi:hypothetical protein NC652_016535 [Populus alba x Populus x berolinensis]|nr:hypothetical protein NC652_016535 [Populus alba x Populus x berolinensis]
MEKGKERESVAEVYMKESKEVGVEGRSCVLSVQQCC